MSITHTLTRNIGNLKGFSTDSIFLRTSNVAEIALNIMKGTDRTLQPRRGYQCQIADIGGLGISTFDNPVDDVIETVTINDNGLLYKRLNKQIYLYYNGYASGFITGADNANPCKITSPNHGLQTGTVILIQGVNGEIGLNDNIYTITVVNANEFTLDNINAATYGVYSGGGTWRELFYYNTGVSKTITGADNGNPCQITSVNHGLQPGNIVLIQGVAGEVELNNKIFTITVVDSNHFTLNGIDASTYGAYISGGTWTYISTYNRYLTFTIFTDHRFLTTNPGWSIAPWSTSPWGAPSGESITCQITENRAAQVNGNQNNVNTINVYFGHAFATNDVIKFTDKFGVAQQRKVTGTTSTSVTIDGPAVSVLNLAYLDQFFDIPFRKGFDVVTPFSLQDFIDIITDPTNGVFGLLVAANGDLDYPAAFLNLVEPTIIDSGTVYTQCHYR